MSDDDRETRTQRVRESILLADAFVTVVADLQGFPAMMVDAADTDSAVSALQRAYGFVEVQARAVLDLPMRRLSALERQRLIEHRDHLTRELADLESTA